MSILEDMDREFVAQRPLPAGSTWLIGGNVWHALMADLVRFYREHTIPFLDPLKAPPDHLFGARLRHIRRMTGWGLALDLDAAEEQSLSAGKVRQGS